MTPSVKDRDNKRPSEIEISKKLLEFPVGHHYLVLYSDLANMRRVYSEYVRGQLEAQPNSVIIILPFYDSTEKVREVLQSNSIDFTKLERQGTFFVIDIVKVISNPYYAVPDIERLRAFVRQVVDQHQETTTFVIADMSVFQMMKMPSDLLKYERTLHKDLKVEKWKELCFYHERDFKTMFTEEQANELLEYHKDRVIII